MGIPARLKRGDTIGVVSPSDPVTAGDEKLEKGVAFLEGRGFRVVLGDHLHSTTLGYAASGEQKAADINRMFADRSVRGIYCSQGGRTANACLPYLDWESIAANPKVLVGISDITVLLNGIYARTGLVTFHGSDVMFGFGWDPEPYDVEEFEYRFLEGGLGPIRPNGARATIRGGSAEGTLLGGNLGCLLKLAGTPYWPDLAGAVLFLEDPDPTPEGCDWKLRQLRQMGAFEQLQGVVVGHNHGLQEQSDVAQLEEILLHVSAGYGFPILKVDDFGHCCPNTNLPVGGIAYLDADQLEFGVLEPCVR